jgi:hypothetical protein
MSVSQLIAHDHRVEFFRSQLLETEPFGRSSFEHADIAYCSNHGLEQRRIVVD